MAKQKLTIEVGATNNVGNVFSSIQKDVKRLKETIGEGSVAGQGLAILRGGGIAAGILGAVRVLGDLSEGFVNARKEGVGMVKAISDALKSNPLFGTFINAGANINELIFGDQAAAARTMAAASAQDARTARMRSRGATVAGGMSGSIGSGQAISQLLEQVGLSESELRARFAEGRAQVQRGPMSDPTRVGKFGGILNQGEIDAAKAYNAELEKLTITVKEYEAVVKSIDSIRARNAQGSVIAGAFASIARFITPEVIKGFNNSRKPTIFGFRNPFSGSADDIARQNAGRTSLPGSPFIGAPGGDPLEAALEAGRGARDAARGSAAGSLLASLQSRLAAARGVRGSLAGILGAGSGADSRIGLSGLQSAGVAGLGGPGAEERRLERAIGELNKITEKQTDDTVKAIEEAKRDIVRELTKNNPGIGDLFNGQR